MSQLQEYPIDIKRIHGSDNPHRCGYCNNQKGNCSYGFDSKKIKPEIYKGLMDCGWRRCGTNYYKPDLFISCCKYYSIRMDATKYEMKKSQKKALKKWNKFIYSIEKKDSEMKMQQETNIEQKRQDKNLKTQQSKEQIKKIVDYTKQDEQQILLKFQVINLVNSFENQKSQIIKELENPEIQIDQVSFVKKETIENFKILPSKCSKKGSYFTNYFMLFFAKNKEALKGIKPNIFIENTQEVIKHLMEQHIKDYTCQLDLNGQLNFFEKNVNNSSDDNNTHSNMSQSEASKNKKQEKKQNNQNSINEMIENKPNNNNVLREEVIQNEDNQKSKDTHEKKIEFIKKNKNIKDESMNSYGGFFEQQFKWDTDKFTTTEIRKGRLTIKVELANSNEQNFGMYQRYCQDIHEKDKDSFDGFKRFLCLQAIVQQTLTSQKQIDQKLNLGCYHMNYYLDNVFIAVGVVDIFEDNLSSVYFFYDPKYKSHSLGVIGAIYEIQYVQQLNQQFPQFQYYYLGFYIQNCQKMVYKGDYGPAELLCPRTYKWYPLDEKTRKLIDSNQKDPSLAPPQDSIDPKMLDSTNKNTLLKFVEEKTRTSFQGQILPTKQFFKFFNPILKQIFCEIASVIDQNLYPKLVFDYSE